MNKIETALLEISVPANLIGFQYLADGIELAISDQSYIRNTIKLYSAVAEKHESIPSRVERGMRHAIETAFLRNEPKTVDKYFGNSIDWNKGKPTNAAFIASFAMALREAV